MEQQTHSVPEFGNLNVEELRQRAEEAAGAIKERFAPVDEWIRTQARERPLVALAVAAGAGYLAGRILRFF